MRNTEDVSIECIIQDDHNASLRKKVEELFEKMADLHQFRQNIAESTIEIRQYLAEQLSMIMERAALSLRDNKED